MGLSKLGDFIERIDVRNNRLMFNETDVKGISTKKEFIDTKADLMGVGLKSYKIVNKNEFAYVADTSRRGEKIAIAYCSEYPCIISSIYTVFRVKNETKLLPRYLMMFFNRSEFDRYARFNSWGSVRETFSWEDMCDIELEIPPIEIQKKYVAIYEGLLANLHSYENKLEDLKLVCDAYIEDLRRKYPSQKIKPYLQLVTDKNVNNLYSTDDVLGVSNQKTIIPTKSDVVGNDLSDFTIVSFNDFIYNPRNGVAIGLNKNIKNKIISFNNTAFNIIDTSKLNPDFLFMFFCRDEFDRKVRFDALGSSTEVYSFSMLCETTIPIPPIEVQNSIVAIFNAYNKRKEFIERLKSIIKDICPILIKGAIEESRR